MDCALLYNDQFTDKLEWIEESRKMKLQDPKEIEVFGIDGRMSQLGYYGLDQLRQGFMDHVGRILKHPSETDDFHYEQGSPSSLAHPACSSGSNHSCIIYVSNKPFCEPI